MNITLFWSSKFTPGQTMDEYRNMELNLSYFHEITLYSMDKIKKNKIRLYTYQKFNRHLIPDKIELLDANDIYPIEEAYSALSRGHSIAHISDLVRLKASIEYNAVILDMDNIMLRPFPEIDCFTSTTPAKASGGMAIKFGPKRPPFKILDGSWDGCALSIFPFKVCPSNKKLVNELVKKIANTLSLEPSKSTKAWNYVMWSLQEIANNTPNMRIMKPIECAINPAWKNSGNCYSLDSPSKFDGKTKLFGVLMPSIDEILDTAFVIPHFFESTFKSAKTVPQDFLNKIKKDSLLDRELIFIYGTQYRTKISGIKSIIDEW